MGNGKRKQFGFAVTAWRKTAETVSQYLTKGSKVLIIGELEEPRTWTDKDGNTQASLDVTAQTIRFLSARGDNAGGGGGGDFQREPARTQSAGNSNGRGAGRQPEPADDGPTDEDIPF